MHMLTLYSIVRLCLRHAWHTYLVYPVDGEPRTQLFFIARPGASIAGTASVKKWRWRVARGNVDSPAAPPRSGARSDGGGVVARHHVRIRTSPRAHDTRVEVAGNRGAENYRGNVAGSSSSSRRREQRAPSNGNARGVDIPRSTGADAVAAALHQWRSSVRRPSDLSAARRVRCNFTRFSIGRGASCGDHDRGMVHFFSVKY